MKDDLNLNHLSSLPLLQFLYMFLIKNRAISHALRSSRNLFKNDTKKTPTQAQPTKPQTATPNTSENTGFVITPEDHSKPFPYKFGGVTQTKTLDLRIESFLPNNRPNFFQLYLQCLKAIQSKNRKLLSQLVQPELIEPLLTRNVKLINQSSSGSFQYNILASGIGVKGPRDPSMRMQAMPPPQQLSNIKQAENIKLYMPQSPMSMFQNYNLAATPNFPIMMSTEVTIKSRACLVQLDTPERQKEQIHVLTFERQAEINITAAMTMVSGFKVAMGGSLSSDKMKSLIYQVEHPWKIANIDHFVKNRWQA